MNTKNKKILLLFLSFFSVIIFFVGVEFFLRIMKIRCFPVQYEYDMWVTSMLKENKFLYDPVLLFKINPKSNGVDINRQGFRGTREYEQRKKDGVCRIICLGDSTTFGVGLQLRDSYPQILETILNEGKKSSFEVLNFGVPGYTSYQGLKLLQTHVINYSPTLVIINFIWNDMWEHQNVVKEDKYQRPPWSFIVRTVNILEKSIFFQLLKKNIYIAKITLGNKIKVKARLRARVSLEDYAANYRQMISLLKEKRIGCIIVIPPADIRQDYMRLYKLRVAILRSVSEEFSVPIIEPNDLFIVRPDDCFLVDGFHLTVFGSTLIAETIVSAMKKDYKNIMAN